MDSGATIAIARLDHVKSMGFQVYPNNQIAKLADNETFAKSVGEIHETFTRNNCSVKFDAIILEKCWAPLVGGNNFTVDNDIQQDRVNKTITIRRKHVFQETNRSVPLPSQPNNHCITLGHVSTLLPDQSITYKVPYADGTVLAIEPHHQNKINIFPKPKTLRARPGPRHQLHRGPESEQPECESKTAD